MISSLPAILLLLVATVYHTSAEKFVNDPICGTLHVRSNIIKGFEPHDYLLPYAAFVKSEQLMCSGTIIGPNLILTAAHCIQPKNRKTVPSADEFQVHTGERFRSKFTSYRKVKKVAVHDDYNKDTRENDVAIMVLEEDIKFDRFSRPACLNTEIPDVPYVNYCKTFGWGAQKLGGAMVDVVNQAGLTRGWDYECADHYKIFDPTKHFCIDTYYGQAPCMGDDGSGYVCKDKTDKKEYVYGILSETLENWCGIYRPLMANIYPYQAWIQSNRN